MLFKQLSSSKILTASYKQTILSNTLYMQYFVVWENTQVIERQHKERFMHVNTLNGWFGKITVETERQNKCK